MLQTTVNSEGSPLTYYALLSTYTMLVNVYMHVHTHFRVYLDQLKSPDDAVRVARQSESTEGAKMVAW